MATEVHRKPHVVETTKNIKTFKLNGCNAALIQNQGNTIVFVDGYKLFPNNGFVIEDNVKSPTYNWLIQLVFDSSNLVNTTKTPENKVYILEKFYCEI